MAKSTKQQDTATALGESSWHVKSLVVYAAAMVTAADMILQAFAADDFWGTTTSMILTIFLWIESYARMRRNKTYLGKLFAPVLSVIIIILIVGERTIL